MSKEKVEIHPACFWICPDCGRNNFEHVITEEFSEDDRDVIDGVQELLFGFCTGGDVVLEPTDVTCPHCGESFESDRKGVSDDENHLDESRN